MIDKILNDKAFIKMMQAHCLDILTRLIAQKIEFNIVAATRFCEYNPSLPSELNPNAAPFALFVLAGYTFESIELDTEKMVFHAGFGPNDFASFVSVDLGAITQIQVGKDIIFVNFSNYQREENLAQKSMNMFLNNPKNKNSLKK